MKKKQLFAFTLVASSLLFSSCKKKEETTTTETIDVAEVSQQVGDQMASLDESGGSSGSFTLMSHEAKTFARLAPGSLPVRTPMQALLLPTAEATTCAAAATFGSCSSGTITRTFGGCTIGAATFSGTVAFNYRTSADAVDSACSDTAVGHRVSRVPNFTATGLRGATLTVSKTGSFGQSLLKVSATMFRYDNDGVRRVFAVGGTTLLDTTTTVTVNDSNAPMAITGTSRTGRTLSGGKITVTDNLKSRSCVFTPTSVTWSGSCNCPESGTFAGTCTDGTTSVAASVKFTACGTATATYNGTEQTVSLDRCY